VDEAAADEMEATATDDEESGAAESLVSDDASEETAGGDSDADDVAVDAAESLGDSMGGPSTDDEVTTQLEAAESDVADAAEGEGTSSEWNDGNLPPEIAELLPEPFDDEGIRVSAPEGGSYVGVEIDEVTEAGFSAEQAAEGLGGERTVTLRYEDGSPDTQLVIGVEPTFEALGNDSGYQFGDEVAVVVPREEPQVRFTADFTFRTEDGIFDEQVSGVIWATAVDAAFVQAVIPLGEVQGEYESHPPEGSTPSPDGGGLWFTVWLMPDEREIEGEVQDTELFVPGDRGVVGTWGPEE
jgi:hypothetical protein